MKTHYNVRCPVCHGSLVPVKLQCDTCHVTVAGRFFSNEFAGLSAEDLHFLPKPFGLKQLAAKVKEVLSGAPPPARVG